VVTSVTDAVRNSYSAVLRRAVYLVHSPLLPMVSSDSNFLLSCQFVKFVPVILIVIKSREFIFDSRMKFSVLKNKMKHFIIQSTRFLTPRIQCLVCGKVSQKPRPCLLPIEGAVGDMRTCLTREILR